MIIWRPGSKQRYTRRQVLNVAGRAAVATIVGGSFADLVAACSRGAEAPPPGAPAPAPAAPAAPAAQPSPAASGPAAATEGVRGGMLRYGTLGNLDYGSLDMTTTTGTYDM